MKNQPAIELNIPENILKYGDQEIVGLPMEYIALVSEDTKPDYLEISIRVGQLLTVITREGDTLQFSPEQEEENNA